MKYDKIESIKGELFKIPPSYIPTYYFDAFNLIYHCENFLRIFVYIVLKAARGNDWLSSPVGHNEDSPTLTIESLSKKILSESATFGHIGRLPKVPMLYLTLDDLISVITGRENVSLFSPIFPASLEAIYKPKLNEVRTTRNLLAHNRSVLPNDIERLYSTIKEIMTPVESYLQNLLNDEYVEFIPKQKADYYPLWTSVILKKRECSYIHFKISESFAWMKVSISFDRLSIATAGEYSEAQRAFLSIDRYKLNRVFTKQMLGNIVCYFHTYSEDEMPGSERIDLYLSYQRFNKCSDQILEFLMVLLDDIEREYADNQERISTEETISAASLKYLHYKIESPDENAGEIYSSYDEPAMAEGGFEEYDSKREEARKGENLRAFYSERFGFAREDVTEDWTISEGPIWAILYGIFPWLI